MRLALNMLAFLAAQQLREAEEGGGGASAPVNSVAPAITGTATVGQTLTASTGTWSGSPAYAYAWERGGVAIGGATASTYLLVSADAGAVITVTVTATNAGGSASATSSGTSAVVAGREYALVAGATSKIYVNESVPWGSEVSDLRDVHSTTTDTGRFTVPASWNGRYVCLSGNFVEDSVENSWYGMRRNGAVFVGSGYFTAADLLLAAGTNIMSAPVLAATSDYFELYANTDYPSGADSTLQTAGTWGQIEVLPSDFNGALVRKTGTQAIAAATNTAVTFDAEEYDLGGFHDNATNNSRLTVPPGVTLVRLSGRVDCPLVGTGQFTCEITRNGAAAHGLPHPETDSTRLGDAVCGMSAPMAVTTGNYFELNAFHASATTILTTSWFAIEVLPPALRYALVNRTVDQSLTSSVAAMIAWTAEVVDTGGWHDNSTNNSRLTVPSGVTHVRVGFNIYASSSSGNMKATVLKNGAAFTGQPRADTNTSGADGVHGWSAILEVVAGDYFECQVTLVSAVATVAAIPQTWFAIEEVPV